MRWLFCLPVLALSLGAWAEEVQPLRYGAFFTVKPGQGEAFVDLIKKYDQPIMERLIGEGSVLGWGIVTPLLHGRMPATHAIWWTCPNYAALDKALAAFEEAEKSQGEEVLKQFLDTVEIDKHYDSLMLSMVFKTKPTAMGTEPYIDVATWQVQPGKGGDWLDHWKKYIQPVYDKLLQDGVILAYGVDREAEHTMDPTMRWTWVVIPDLAAEDKIDAAFDAAHTKDEWDGINSEFREVSEGSSHRDVTYYSLAFTTQ
jgi:hypothetical protein